MTPAVVEEGRSAQTGSSLPSRQQARRHWRSWAALLIFASLLALIGVGVVAGPVCAASKPPPNILLIVMDDIGIDQWALFGYGGATPAAMPNIAAIAKAGIKFRNLWVDAGVLERPRRAFHRPLSVPHSRLHRAG